MIHRLIILLLLFLPASLSGQSAGTDSVPACGHDSKTYTLLGFRHGISFFPAVRFPQVQYKTGDTLDFGRYHSLNVIYSWLSKWQEKYPRLVDLYEIGKSFEGRPVMQLTITNKETGKDTDKPAAYFEGGRHSGEITGSECVMWFAKYLLENYGMDAEVTHLLNTKTIYLRPVNNPDGQSLYLNTAQSNRSSVRPEDNDNDGLLDEDAPEDLDGDGLILNMRWKDEKKGNFIPDPDDSTGRIMKRVASGKGIYRIESEGIDNDGDGKINEDGIGGLDLHRNYPENWRPVTEETGRGFTQSGAGEYPLSEPETESVVSFLLKHPNISVVNSMDTSVPMHLRPPSTSPGEERMYPEDLAWYKVFDETGKKITGYKKAGDVYNDYGNGNPLFGHGPDFGYWYFGSVWYGDEIWNGARFRDYNNDGDTSQIDILRWDDEENGGEGFTEWKPAKHPVYGDIETGGFNLKFFSQNPPVNQLEEWIRKEALFNLEMAKSLPEPAWDKIEVKKIKSYKTDSVDYQVKISVKNQGKLPTALRQAQLVKIVKEDRIELEFDTAGYNKDMPGFRVIEDKKPVSKSRKREMFNDEEKPSKPATTSKKVAFIQGGSSTEAIFIIRFYGKKEVNCKAKFISTRGGVLKEKEFQIK
jgi:hypothetical protein